MKNFLTTVLCLLWLWPVVGSAQKVAHVEQPKDIPSFVGYVQDEFVIAFKEEVGRLTPRMSPRGIAMTGVGDFDVISEKFVVSGIRKQFVRSSEDFLSPTRELSRFYKVKFEDGSLEEAMDAFRQHPMVDRVEPIGIHATYAMPNDGYFVDQWHLNQANDCDIDAPEAWDIETGSDSKVVAIFDTGVRYFHKDLGGSNASYSNPEGTDGNMWINWAEKNGTSGVDDDGNGYVDDWVGWDFVDGASSCWTGEDCNDQDNDPRDFNGHGTHCAGNVSAINNNGYATCAPSGGWGNGTLEATANGVKVMACRIGWSGKYATWEVGYVRMDFAAEAFYYAADNGADIVSCSWGSSNTGGIGAAIDYFLANGGMVFHAAGNDGSSSADYMGSRSDIINVAATDANDCKADFSNYGTWVDISAPGTGIWSSYHSHDDPQSDYVAAIDGTSMSSPLAASVAALIWSKNPTWTASQVEQQLYDSADDIYGLSCNSSYIGKLGAGRINAHKAVSGEAPPVAEFEGSPRLGCAPLTVNFTDKSTGTITSWWWEFGDGGTSAEQNPSYTYQNSGDYTVSLTVTGPSGSDTEIKTDYVSISDVPVADFSGSTTAGCQPLIVDFTDLSTGNPASWNWDFGDGGTSIEQNPIYTYNDPGVYTITLTAANTCGSDVAVKTDYIQVDSCGPTKAFAISDIPEAGTVSGDYTSTHASDNSYEVITEVLSTSHPVKVWSYLEHRWDFDVAPGGMIMFYVEAYRPNNSDGDNFAFEYSTDNSTYNPLVTVNSSVEQTYSTELPSGISGTVYVRVVDTDRGKRQTSLDPVYIDYMYIESGGSPPPPDTMFVNSIDVTRIGGRANRYQGQAVVVVHRLGGLPVFGATVSGHFTGPSSDNVSGTTDGDGVVTLLSSKVKSPSGYWCFYIDDISLGSNIYDPSRNVENYDCEPGGAAVAKATETPDHIGLVQNYPNPFNPTTQISFHLRQPSDVRMEVFNIVGQKVATLVSGRLEAGLHSFEWDATHVASGVYLYRLETSDYVETKKMLLLK